MVAQQTACANDLSLVCIASAGRGASLYHPAPMRRAGPILIVVIGLAALIVDFFPGLRAPASGDQSGGSRPLETKLGLDLQFGLLLHYRVKPVVDANCKLKQASAD